MAEEVIETTEITQSTPEVVETQTTPEAVQAETQAWYATYGYENEDQFRTELEELKGYKTKSDEIEQRLTILREAEKPHANETVATLDAFVRKTGIEDISVIAKIMTASEETLGSQPMEALKLAMRINSPSKYEKMEKMEGGVEAMFRERYNLDMEGEYTPPRQMIADALDAIESIQKIKSDVKVTENPYTFAHKQREEARATFEAGQKVAAEALEKTVSGLTEVTDKQGDQVFTLKVTKEEIQQILKEKDQIATYFHDANTPDGQAKLQKFVHDKLLIQKYLNGEVRKEWENKRAADVEQAATREVLNGQAIEPDRSSNTSSQGEMSPIMKQAIADGKTIPAGF